MFLRLSLKIIIFTLFEQLRTANCNLLKQRIKDPFIFSLFMDLLPKELSITLLLYTKHQDGIKASKIYIPSSLIVNMLVLFLACGGIPGLPGEK